MPKSGRNNLYRNFKSLFSRSKIDDSKGFTLIELLIVVAVTGILSTVILANYTGFGARQEVRNVAEEFKSELRKYQTFAIAGHKNPDQSGNCSDLDKVLEYYQIEINDNVTPAKYDVVVDCTLDSIPLPTKYFPENIIVDASSVCGSGNLTIRFFPLNQGTEIFCPSGPVSTVDIKFSRSGTDYFVRVTNIGEIQVHK